MGTLTIKYQNYKITEETLGKIVEYALEQGYVYPELLGKDRLETLVVEL